MTRAAPRPPIPAAGQADRDAAFRVLLPLVTGWCARLGAGRIDAEAAAQDALLVILRRFDDLVPGAPIEPFAWGVVTRVVRDHRRRAWWRRWLPGAEVEPSHQRTPGAELASNERARQVATLLDRLPDAQREVLVLCDVEERDGKDVALLLAVPEGSVRSRLGLARAALRRMAEEGGLKEGLQTEEDT